MSQLKNKPQVSLTLSEQLKQLNANNPVTQMLRDKQHLELMDYLLSKPESISSIYGDKIGSVLKLIRTEIESHKEDMAELQYKNMTDKYQQLKNLIRVNHPMAKSSDKERISNLIRCKEWSQLTDIFCKDPSLFWDHVYEQKVGYVIASIRRNVFNIQDNELHSADFIKWKQKINSKKPRA